MTRAIFGTSFALLLCAACNRAPAAAADAGAAEPPLAVTSAEVTAQEVPATLRLSGTLRGNRETDLAANASGRVLSTEVERGTVVTANQVLAKLDVRAAAISAKEASTQAASSRAQQEISAKECARYETLKAKGAVSDLEYDRVVAQCTTQPLTAEAAAARAQLAAQNVGDGIIRAPFAGVVAERQVEVGQYVKQDSKVVTLVSLDPMRLELAVPEADIGKVKVDADVSFRVAAFPDRRFSGKIRFVSGALRSATRDLVVEAIVPNPDKALLPGMFADVELTTGTKKLPSIPRAALLDRDGQTRAFVLSEGRAEERLLLLGPSVGDRVSVQHGVREGELVATNSVDVLSNGQRVR